jgi:lipopolysaccharide assembly protein A
MRRSQSGSVAMTEQSHPQGGATTLPPPSPNGSSPPPPVAPRPAKAGRMHTRISGIRIGLIAAFAGLIVVMIFIIQNAHAVSISFLGAHVHLSLAVALLLATIAGAMLMAAAGTARITQLRRIMRRDRRTTRPADTAAITPTDHPGTPAR